jgi:hypothetical protein
MKTSIFLPIKKYLAINHKRIKNIPRKGIISKFAEKIGLLYFGTVSQHSDEYRVIRGFTASSTHHDNHFCVGTVGGYDVSVVDRSDVRHAPDGSIASLNWLIFAFELKTPTAIPHFFVSSNNTDQKPYVPLLSTNPNLKEVVLGNIEMYDKDFTTRFTVYCQPSKSLDIYEIITPELARVVAAHFWPLRVEQYENTLYIYSTHEKITSSLLETMLENGLWLAGQIDKTVFSKD